MRVQPFTKKKKQNIDKISDWKTRFYHRKHNKCETSEFSDLNEICI